MAESKRAAASARAGGGAEEKAKALETALAQIKKQFGEGAVMRLGQDSALNVEAIPTGSLSLDLALGIGGVPRGRIIEIYGPESSGKTTLALHCIAEGQKRGGNAAFIDVEHALDPVYAGNLGVDVDSLLVSQPDTGEQCLGNHRGFGALQRHRRDCGWTPWRPWCPGRRSRARWATPTWACRPG